METRIYLLVLLIALIAQVYCQDTAGPRSTFGGRTVFANKEKEIYHSQIWNNPKPKNAQQKVQDALKNQENSNLRKIQTEQYMKEFEKAEDYLSPPKSHLESPHEDCYTLSYPEDETAKDLEYALLNDAESLIVTVWFYNFQNQWGQNLYNQDVRGTLWKLICKYHSFVTYTEADLSNYNSQGSDYKALAENLGIDLRNIFDGPSVTILHNKFGDALRSEKGPRDLIVKVDDYLSHKEAELYNTEPKNYDIIREILAPNKYDDYMPSDHVEKNPSLYQDKNKMYAAPLRQSLHISPKPQYELPLPV
ncbi:unnamed protein product [Moneuplotes crassus]|uniref:Uncharacterized protein n=1 Tax=Euplotes crassus TaxID=5936 RepID=A0AAD1XQD2_EUPCR|nr:unnamed protein product [Moneuplotes crassus]